MTRIWFPVKANVIVALAMVAKWDPPSKSAGSGDVRHLSLSDVERELQALRPATDLHPT